MKSRIGIYLAGAIVVSGVWLFLLYTPAKVEQKAIQEETASVQEQMDDYNRTISELPKAIRTSSDLAAFRDQLNSSLYAKEDILQLFEQLNSAAIDKHLELIEISPPVEELITLNRTVNSSGEPEFLNITLNLNGQYSDFGKFVSDLEKAPYFRSVSACNIGLDRDRPNTLDFKLSFRALLGSIEESA